MVVVRCWVEGCDARAEGPLDIATEMIENHIERMHRDFCSLCGGTGTIPAVPTPMECPNCGGDGGRVRPIVDEPEPQTTLGEFVAGELNDALETAMRSNVEQFNESVKSLGDAMSTLATDATESLAEAARQVNEAARQVRTDDRRNR